MMPALMKIDFHVHTEHSSDSIIKPHELAKKSKSLGIIPAITDHNSISAHSIFRSLNIPFIPGEEIQTNKGDLVGLYISELIEKNTPFLEAIDSIREQGGIVYLPHMYDRRKKITPSDSEVAKADIIEVFNARCILSSFNDRARQFAEKHDKLMAAGSDSHFLFEFGSTYTELPDFDISNPKELLKSMEKAKLKCKKAPFFVRGTTASVLVAKKILKSLG